MDIEIICEFAEKAMAQGYHRCIPEFHEVAPVSDYLCSVRAQTGWGRNCDIIRARLTGRYMLVQWVDSQHTLFHVVTTWDYYVNSGPPMQAFENLKHTAEISEAQMANEVARIQAKREHRIAQQERCREIGRKLVRHGADPDNPVVKDWTDGALPVAVTDSEREAVHEHWEQKYAKTWTGKTQVAT